MEIKPSVGSSKENGVVEAALSVVARDDYDSTLTAAWKALDAAHARAGTPLPRGEISRVARRFQLDGAQVAELGLRGELAGIVERGDLGESARDVSTYTASGETQSVNLDILTVFRRDLGLVRLLTRAEEIALGDAIADGSRARIALLEVESTIHVVRLEETIQRAIKARDELFHRNIPLVLHLAPKFSNLGLDHLDVIQSGFMGLLRATEKWDPHRGYRFTTYAYFWIEQSIRRYLSDTGRTIRLPVHVVEKLVKLRKSRRNLSSQLGREPSVTELAEFSGIDVDKVAFYSDIDHEMLSLDNVVGDDDTTTLRDFVVTRAESNDDPERALLLKERNRMLRDCLNALSPREQFIVASRFGLNGIVKTLEQVGQLLGITRERVRQIEAKAIKKLRYHAKAEYGSEAFST